MAIPSGMQMMLKSMGVDPAQILESIESFKRLAEGMAATQRATDAKLDTLPIIDAKIDMVLSKQDEILTHLSGVDQSPMPGEWPEVTLKELEAMHG